MDDLDGVTIQVRPPENDKKDLSAKIGQAKSKLCFIRGYLDMAAGTITHISYSIILKSLLTGINKPHSVRMDLMQSML